MRRVRKTPITEKIKNYPFDLWLSINEWTMSIYWDEYSHISFGLGNLLSILFIFVSKLNNYSNTNKASSSIFQSDYYSYDRIKQKAIKAQPGNSISTGLIQFFSIVLFTASIINTIKLMVSVKTYSLLNSEKPNTPSVKETLLNEGSSKWVHFLTLIFSSFKKIDDSFIDDSGTTDTSNIEINLFDKVVYEMHVWDPSKFQLFLFSGFNPFNLLIIKLINELSIWKILFIVLIFNCQLYWVIDKFFILLNDKQILYQEMFSEYNNKYVKPKTEILKRDVGIDASKYNNHHDVIIEQSNPFFQSVKLKVFIAHDINGKPVNVLNNDDDSFSDERKKFESEKIKFELEKEKFNQLNNSMILDVDESWFNSTSTPHKAKLPSLNRSFLDNSRSFIETQKLSPSRLTSPNRPISPTRQTSPSRNSINQSSPMYRSMSPPKSPSKRTSIGSGYPSSPSRSTQSSRYDRYDRRDTRDESRFGYRPPSPRKFR